MVKKSKIRVTALCSVGNKNLGNIKAGKVSILALKYIYFFGSKGFGQNID